MVQSLVVLICQFRISIMAMGLKSLVEAVKVLDFKFRLEF